MDCIGVPENCDVPASDSRVMSERVSLRLFMRNVPLNESAPVCLPAGEYLEKIIPLVVKFCNIDDDELREYCIQAFESFVRRSVVFFPH